MGVPGHGISSRGEKEIGKIRFLDLDIELSLNFCKDIGGKKIDDDLIRDKRSCFTCFSNRMAVAVVVIEIDLTADLSC